MKRITFAALLVFLVAAAAAALVQTQRATQLAGEVAALRSAAAENESRKKTDADHIAALENKTKILNAESAQLRGKLKQLAAPRLQPGREETPVATGGDADNAGSGESGGKNSSQLGFFQKMLKDPEMKKTIAAQSSFAMRQFYADFLKTAHLPPADTERFYQLLSDRQMALMDGSMAILEGRDSAEARAGDMERKKEAAEEPLKTMLGPEKFAQFQGYEKSLPDRMQLAQLGQQLAASGAPLQEFQSSSLLQIMADERAKQPAQLSANDPAAAARLSDADLDSFVSSQQELNARVRTRASSVLNAQQMSAFEAYQKQMIETQKFGMKMARDMMKKQ